MTSAGLLSIAARYGDGQLTDLSLVLRRPPVNRLFIGQAAEAVVKTVPYLYTLCAQAQRAAAQAALTAAGAIEARPVDDAALWTEVLHEHLWRLLLDWPAALGLVPARDAFIAWRAERHGEYRLVATQRVLDETLPRLVEKCREILVDCGPAAAIDLQLLRADDWLAYWQGKVALPPAVRLPDSVGAAFENRLSEVHRAFAALAAGAAFPIASAGQAAWGVGQTLTARGLLTHATRLGDDGLVADYRVWAPTDCHFANADALRGLLAGVSMPDIGAARLAVERAVLALDPCLPHVVELRDA